MKQTVAALILLLTVALAACTGAAAAEGSPDIKYGRDICVQCGMIISEENLAAAYTVDDGTEKIFDDLGGLLLHQRATGDTLDPEHTWVHDFETAELVDVANAYFVATLSVSTPICLERGRRGDPMGCRVRNARTRRTRRRSPHGHGYGRQPNRS